MNIPLVVLSEALKKQIDEIRTRYPKNTQSSIMPALMLAQEHNEGSLTNDLIQAIANHLNIPHISAQEVATFYSMYELKPVGRFKISVCTNVSCLLRDCDAMIEKMETYLGIKMGETTSDGRFTLKKVECLAACDKAPAIQINGELKGPITVDNIEDTLKQY